MKILSLWLSVLRKNLRARLALAAILSILAIYQLLTWQERVVQLQAAYLKQQQQIKNYQQLATEVRWLQSAQRLERTVNQLEQMVWRNKNQAMQRAALSDRLNNMLKTAQPSNPNSGVIQDAGLAILGGMNVQLPAGYKSMRANLAFDYEHAALSAILADMDSSPVLRFESFKIIPGKKSAQGQSVKGQSAARVEAVVSAYYRESDGSEEKHE
ncbi:hypothetical protein [Deefgea piscis]|uniref:hypothetical protein n=1 Tax=Deefgea piscis TaxID=2739061 RepID=UPI001C7E2A96|nr:hypothetical protein [Deefgea piscis]QZA80547.1 hypothetical protein K4H25_13650 [Deefgea piscis]